MPVFTYNAIDATGKKRTGTADARSKASAVALLKEQGLYVVSLVEQKQSIVDQLLSVRGVPDTEVVAFTRQLSTMISAGLPIARGLEVLAEQSQNRKMKTIILEVLRDVQGGASLSTAMGKYRAVFPPTYIALVAAGESSGKLEEILKRLADTLESQRDFRSRFKSAMVYPAIIFMSMIGVFVLMMVFVIPKLSGMYESMNVELPTATKAMIGISNFMVDYWYVLLIVLVFLVLGARTFFSTEEGKKMFASFVSKLPIFGKLIKQKDLTEFARTLSLLIASGISIVEALDIVSTVVSTPVFQQGCKTAAQSVEKGGSLSDYLKQDKNFPSLLGQMTAVGEETGKLDEVLNRIGIFFATETEHAVKGLSSALEPVILILLGGMVGVLIVSIITPIYKITSSL